MSADVDAAREAVEAALQEAFGGSDDVVWEAWRTVKAAIRAEGLGSWTPDCPCATCARLKEIARLAEAER